MKVGPSSRTTHARRLDEGAGAGPDYDSVSARALRTRVAREHAGGMRHHARILAILLSTLGALLVVPPPGGAAVPDPLTRQHLLTLGDYESVYPRLRQPFRVVLRSPVFAPRGCEDRGKVVRGATRIQGSLSTGARRRSVALIDQNLVRFETVRQARSLVRRYRHFSKACVGDVQTDDGEGGQVLLKNRAWQPPRVGDQSAGMLIGWFSGGSATWRRVLAVRVGRTVSVLDVSFADVRPPQGRVLDLGGLAIDRLG